MTGDEQSTLGQQIDKRNPYSFLLLPQPAPPAPPNSSMHLLGGATPPPPAPFPWMFEIEEDAYVGGSWHFRGRDLRIAKAIRIPYYYQDKYGNLVKEYLLIGYEGGGSD